MGEMSCQSSELGSTPHLSGHCFLAEVWLVRRLHLVSLVLLFVLLHAVPLLISWVRRENVSVLSFCHQFLALMAREVDTDLGWDCVGCRAEIDNGFQLVQVEPVGRIV